MTKKEFIAELLTDLKQYDESNLIDQRSVSLWIKNKMKRFGNNIMIDNAIVLKVENGKAELPDDFWRLKLAVKCEPEGYSVDSDDDNKALISSFTFKTRVEENYVWNNQIDSFIKDDYKKITEKVYLGSNYVSYYYKSPIILRLSKGTNKDVCLKGCKNLESFAKNSPWEISISNNIIFTNFTKGYIYIQYAGLPVDENGELIIPDTPLGHLQEYLMYYCKAKLMENLMGNGDEPNLINMYNLYSAKEKQYFSLAMTEIKFSRLSSNWDVKMKNKMRINSMKFENLFPNI